MTTPALFPTNRKPSTATLVKRLVEADTLRSAFDLQRKRPERRRARRIRINEPVLLLVGADTWTGCLVDFSTSGLCIQTDSEVTAGAAVAIEWCYGYFIACVRNCRPAGDKFLVGVELEPLPCNAHLIAWLDKNALRAYLRAA